MMQIEQIYNSGIVKLSGWKIKYSNEEYPKKVLSNMYYNQFSMLSMWNFIEDCFDYDGLSGNYHEYQSAYNRVSEEFSIHKEKVLPYIKVNMENVDYETKIRLYKNYYDKILARIETGDISEVSKIESDFMVNFISNSLILTWAAMGLTGVDKASGYGKITGYQYLISNPKDKEMRYGSDLAKFKVVVENIVAQNPPSNFI